MINASLCITCRHAKRLTSPSGSVFLLCLRAESDKHFRRYPSLPVVKCAGYDSVGDAASKK